MAKRIVKFVLIGMMLVEIVFSLFNFIAVKSRSAVYWQVLEQGIDPALGTKYIRCWHTDSTGVSVIYPLRDSDTTLV
jgi:hypothetical protein